MSIGLFVYIQKTELSRSCSAGLHSCYSVLLSAQNYGRHGSWEKSLIPELPVSVELRKILEKVSCDMIPCRNSGVKHGKIS
jgi:hypothetical protein